MANYNIDIAVALKGAKQLTSFNREVKATSTSIDSFAKQLKSAAKDQNILVKNLDNLNLALANAKKNFNAVASGTSLQEKAARQLVLAEKQLNKEYQQRERLLNNLRTSYTPMPLPGSGVGSDPIAKSIARRQRKLLRGANQYSGPIGPGEAVPANLRSPLPPSSPLLRSSIDPGQSLFGQSVGGASDRARQILAEEQALQAALANMGQRFTGPGNITPMELTGQSESIFRGQSVNIERRIEQTLENRKKSEKEIIKIRETAAKKREIKEKKLIELRKRSEKLIAQDRERAISARGRIASNIPTIGNLAGGFRGQFKEGGAFAATGGQRAKGALSNALIGGGFPLLFGQGALGAAGGGIGGALGGALGGGFGFGLSIAGTALAQQIQQTLDFRKSIRELNKEMERMGISSNISGSQVRQLGKSLGITKEEAVKALQEFKRFGNQAVLIAEKFGGDFAKFDAIAQANTVQSALAAIRKINKDLTLDDELRFINSVRRLGVEATINQMLDEMLEKEKKIKTEGFGQGEGKNTGANRKRLGQLNRERDATQEIVDKNKAFSAELTIIRDKFVENRDAAEATNRSIESGLEEVNAEIRKLKDAQFLVVELSKEIGSAFSQSFKGIIKGTMSVGDAFRNMFMRIADHFLDMAAQMAAASISKGFMGFLGNIFGGLGGGLPSSQVLGQRASAMTGIPMDLPAGSFANGGYAQRNKSYLVGERGPELFTPGAAGGQVSPMGSTNIVVNVDASGSSVQGDEDQGRELGRLISVAVQSEIIQQQRPGGLLA